MDSKKSSPDFYQNVVVMRHGERMDNFEPLWTSTATRPWDPPLFRDGWVRALETGWTLRNSLGFPIHRVFVSPFLRCVQTASEVVTALCAIHDYPNTLSSHAIPIDPSKVKISVEYGLCEMMNSTGIRPGVAPKDGNFRMDISKCEALLPAGTVDDKGERLYKEVEINSYLFFLLTMLAREKLKPKTREKEIWIGMGLCAHFLTCKME